MGANFVPRLILTILFLVSGYQAKADLAVEAGNESQTFAVQSPASKPLPTCLSEALATHQFDGDNHSDSGPLMTYLKTCTQNPIISSSDPNFKDLLKATKPIKTAGINWSDMCKERHCKNLVPGTEDHNACLAMCENQR
jgi:hypothetical protein